MAVKGIEPMHDEHVNVTPLIDVVMCLIIFFLLCGRLVKEQAPDKVVVPKAVMTPLELTGDLSGRLVINLVPREAAPGQPINPNEMPQVVIRTVALNHMNDLVPYLRNEKRITPNIRIVLRADKDLSYEWIAPVLVACAQADINTVHFSTKQE